MPQGAQLHGCHRFFLSRVPRTLEGSSSKSQPAGTRTPGQQLTPEESLPVGTSVSALHGHDATWPSLALWTKDVFESGGFSYPHLQMRIFLKTAVAARGMKGGFIYSHSFSWAFWNYHFSPEFSSGGGCL